MQYKKQEDIQCVVCCEVSKQYEESTGRISRVETSLRNFHTKDSVAHYFLGGEGGDLLDERLHHEFWFAATRASRGGLRQGRAWDSDSYQLKDCFSEGE